MSLIRQAVRAVGRAPRRGGAHGHGHEHTGPQPPNGFLYGEKPLLPGETRQKASWENVYVYGFIGSLFVAAAGVYFAPDTNWDTWARPIAEQRLKEKESAKSS